MNNPLDPAGVATFHFNQCNENGENILLRW